MSRLNLFAPASTLLFAALTTANVEHSLSYNGLATTPQMGWDTYNAYGLDYNESTIRENAQTLATLGLRDLGYNVVIFDDAMTELTRSASGDLVENAEKFPSGLKNISSFLHGVSLMYGVYSSAGRFTCGGYPGSLGYETQDARWWADRDADYLKYDNCYNEGQSGTPLISQDRYAAMSNALNTTGRNFTYSICNWGDDKPWEWASTIANSARISGDIYDSFDRPTASCPCGPDEYYCELPGYACNVHNILGKASHITSKNQPGYWNDLDMLEVGNGNMDYEEYKLHFSMWAAIKSPLIMGNKLPSLSPDNYGILINPAVIALNQDPLGSAIQRRLVETPSTTQKDRWNVGEVQVWSGSLYGGDQVVAFLNFGNTSITMTYSLDDIFGGVSWNSQVQTTWDLYDLWGNETVIPASVAAQVLNSANGSSTTAPTNNTTNTTNTTTTTTTTTTTNSNSTSSSSPSPSPSSTMTNIAAIDGGKWYYNATATSFAAGLARNESLLMGTPNGSVAAGGSISAVVPRHGLKMWRLKEVAGGGMPGDKGRRDES